MFNEIDVVTLTADFPEHGVMKGELGTIVHIHTNPHLAYEVEFVDSDGETTAMFPVLPHQIELWRDMRRIGGAADNKGGKL